MTSQISKVRLDAWLNKLATKKRVLLIGLAGGIAWVLIWGVYTYFFHGNGVCRAYYAGGCLTLFNALGQIGVLTNLILLLPPMLIVGFLSDKVFKPWARFALLWMLVIIVLPNFVSDASHNFSPSARGYFDLLLLALYILISLAIILIQSIRVYWLKK
ncbi:MAG TPA: hypothetical protein VF829_01845 [Candidatus Paceibacterota bacterium]